MRRLGMEMSWRGRTFSAHRTATTSLISQERARRRPKGSFPENIRGTGNLNLTLRKDGYAGESSKYSMYLRTKDGKYARQIVVAAYTGRVRIVRDA